MTASAVSLSADKESKTKQTNKKAKKKIKLKFFENKGLQSEIQVQGVLNTHTIIDYIRRIVPMVEQWSPKRAIPSLQGIQPSVNFK